MDPGARAPAAPGALGPRARRAPGVAPRNPAGGSSWRPSSGAGWRVVDLVADGLAAESAPPIARPELLIYRFTKGLFASFIKQFMTCNLEEAKKFTAKMFKAQSLSPLRKC